MELVSIYLAALAAPYLTLYVYNLQEPFITFRNRLYLQEPVYNLQEPPPLKTFGHKEGLLRPESLQIFYQRDVKSKRRKRTKGQTDKMTNRQKTKRQKDKKNKKRTKRQKKNK